jgi:hypothetical protein
MNRKIVLLLIPVLLIAVTLLLLFPNHKLIDYKNSSLDIKTVNSILKYGELYDKYENVTIDNLNINIDLVSGLYTNNYKKLEYDASILFSLIKDINKVTFSNDSNTYIFEFATYDKLFNVVKNADLSTLKSRLDNMSTDKIYLGNINGIYDLYDKSEACELSDFTIYEDSNFKYDLKCSKIDLIEVIDKSGNIYTLIDALNNNLFNVENLLNKNLNITKIAK